MWGTPYFGNLEGTEVNQRLIEVSSWLTEFVSEDRRINACNLGLEEETVFLRMQK
jgi:hypothetical protein